MSYYLLSFLSTCIPIAPLFIGLFFVHVKDIGLQILLLYFVVNFLTSIISTILALYGLNNLWMMNIFTPIQFGFLMWILAGWQRPELKTIFFLSIPTFTIVWLVALTFFESLFQFNSITRPLEALTLICASGYTLFQLIKRDIDSLLVKPSFWISSGMLIYFTGMIILFSLSNILLKESIGTLRLVWVPIQSLSNITSHLLFAVGFLCLRPR